MSKPTPAQVEEAFTVAVDNRCSVGKMLAGMEPAIRAVVEAKIADEVHYSATTIARVCKNLGLGIVSRDKVTEHRRGECRCPEVR